MNLQLNGHTLEQRDEQQHSKILCRLCPYNNFCQKMVSIAGAVEPLALFASSSHAYKGHWYPH